MYLLANIERTLMRRKQISRIVGTNVSLMSRAFKRCKRLLVEDVTLRRGLGPNQKLVCSACPSEVRVESLQLLVFFHFLQNILQWIVPSTVFQPKAHSFKRL